MVLLSAIALIQLSACDGGGGANEDKSPTVVDGISNERLNAGGETVDIDLRSVFSAPNGGEVTFSASSSDASIVETSIQDETLTVTSGSSGGRATVTVTAKNSAGSAEDVFTVEVFANPPGRP